MSEFFLHPWYFFIEYKRKTYYPEGRIIENTNVLAIKTKRLKNIGLKIILPLFSFALIFLVQKSLAIEGTVVLLPAPPINVSISHLTPTEVELAWNASLSPAASITSYEIYYKLKTSPSYPLTPQIVREDSLASYTEVITVASNTGYDFKVYSKSTNGLKSSDACASCETTNALCGNDVLEPGENCDGTDLNNLTCSDFDATFGDLSCTDSCTFDSSECFDDPDPGPPPAGGGGGGSTTVLQDTIPPITGTASSPASQTYGTIRITYSGAFDTGGSGFSHVSLYYKKDAGSWLDSGLIFADTAGNFDFTAEGDGVYYFDLRAYDNQGNSSSRPMTGDGDTFTIYDSHPPIFKSLLLGSSFQPNYVSLNYSGALDVGPSGLKKVELWTKTREGGEWRNSGLFSEKPEDSFNFPAPAENETYYFSLVLEDMLGNRTENPTGEGDLSLKFSLPASQVILTGLPSSVTDTNSANIQVAGSDLVAYKYQLNGQDYSQEIPIEKPLILSDLPEGQYELKVIAKNSDGIWSDLNPVTYTWSVDFNEPKLFITGPFPASNSDSDSTGDQITYKLTYTDFDRIDLTLDDIFLITNGNVTGLISLSQESDSVWVVTISDIQGSGSLRIEVLSGTASRANGKLAANAYSPFFNTLTVEDRLDNVTNLIQNNDSAIVPSPPALRPSAGEIQQIAVDSLKKNASKIKPRGFVIPVPKNLAERVANLDRCQVKYPSVDFNLDQDTDSDGLSDRTECYALTNPLFQDTDEDGCSDGDEANLLATNPLNKDCPLKDDNKLVWITSPQNEWTISKLEIKGLTTSETSIVDLVIFPIREGRLILGEGVNIGTIAQFNESGIKDYYFFEWIPDLFLKGGQMYELIAVSTLKNGEMITSPSVRFTLDPKDTANPPVPMAIQNQIIDPSLELKNVQVWTNGDGKINVSGRSEYGARVYVTWKSIVLTSSIINDSDLGMFSIQSPIPLELDQQHEVTLFAVKEKTGKNIRSPDVTVPFFLHKINFLYYLLIIILLRVPFLFFIYTLNKHYKNN